MKIRHLEVSAADAQAGMLHRESQYVFNYSTTTPANEVSLTMPIRAKSYATNPLMPVFSMNLPEGFVYDMIARRMAKHEAIDDMRMLAITGRNQIGRLNYQVPGDPREAAPPQIGLAELLAPGSSSSRLFDFLVDAYFDGGISGVQPKALVPDADQYAAPSERATVVHADLIVKSAGAEYPWLTQNEFLCMEAARRAGLSVPEFWLSHDGGLFIMRRFDLEPNRRGFEDMAVLMGKPRDAQGNYKYTGSYEDIARTIATYSGTSGPGNLRAFFEYLVLSIMVRNGDAHLKNFGLQYDHPAAGTCVLAPLYDVVTTTIYPYLRQRTGESVVDRTMALKLFSGVKDRRYPSRAELVRFGREICHTARPEQVFDRIATAMGESLREHRDRLTNAYAEQITAEWESGREVFAK